MGVRAGLLIITALALAEFAVTPPSIAHAQERPAQARHVSISLVAETRSVVPGHSFHLALRQQIEAVARDAATLSDTGPEAIMVSSPIEPVIGKSSGQLAFAWALVLAFAGGVLLNLMPCVLPILSIKAFSLAQHAQSAAREVRVQGIAYTAGVLASFAAIAALLLGMRAAGNEIGWGFQLQAPLFVALMIYVLFAVGLNLSGVFSFGERIAGAAGELSSSHASYSGSFLTGALATLVATPCTAPIMA